MAEKLPYLLQVVLLQIEKKSCNKYFNAFFFFPIPTVPIAIPFMTAGLLVTFAQNVYAIYAGRVITGFCIGIVSLSLPVYLAEAIHPEVRGILGLLPTTIGT